MKKLIPLIILVALVLGAAVYFYTGVDTSATTPKDQTNFAIKDTANVGKIFLADSKGRTITLTREPEGWMVDKQYVAREDAVALLLNTFHNVYIQRPVAKEAQEQVNRIMVGTAKKVEIYDLNGKWLKTWFVGHGTMDKKGTYMLLETPEDGRAAAPYILDMRGFLGTLDTRFFTDLQEWRSVRIFQYKDMGLTDVKVEYPSKPESSFRIAYKGGNDLSLFSLQPQAEIAEFDSALVKDYLLNFKLASFENFNALMTEAQEDSIRSTQPYQIITVEDAKRTREIRLWSRPAPEGQMEMNSSIPAVIDRERVYACMNNGELAFAQRLTWDKFSAPLQVFMK